MTKRAKDLTPLQTKILLGVLAMPGDFADWFALAEGIWPVAQFPKAWNYRADGGPAGWSMNLSRAVHQLEKRGLVVDWWKAPGVRTIRLTVAGIEKAKSLTKK